MDWRHRLIVRKLAEGCTYGEAATAAGISRQALWKRVNASPEFAAAVLVAREEGKSEREYRAWLRASVSRAQAAYR